MDEDKSLDELVKDMTSLMNQADSGSESSDPDKLISSAFIYSAFAEFLAYNLLKTLLMNIEYLNDKYGNPVHLNTDMYDNKKRTNLSYTYSKLEYLEFSKKPEVIKLLNQLSDTRDELFHNLVSKYGRTSKYKPFVIKLKKQTKQLLIYYKEIGAPIVEQIISESSKSHSKAV